MGLILHTEKHTPLHTPCCSDAQQDSYCSEFMLVLKILKKLVFHQCCEMPGQTQRQ